jgi:DNA-binding GntR family transcriptional regulator
VLKLVKEHSTKAGLVYQTLLSAILANELRPGTRLIVKDIADQLSVSDIPVREALKMLEATCLIETKPYVGSVVTTPSPEWIEEVFVMRAGLESMATRTSIPRLEPADIKAIVALHTRIKKAARNVNTAEYARLNREFHKAITAKCPFPNLLNMIDDLLRKSQYGRAIFGLNPGALKESGTEHDELLQAVLAHDAGKAEAITRKHRLRVGAELSKVIRDLCLSKVEEAGHKEQKHALIH